MRFSQNWWLSTLFFVCLFVCLYATCCIRTIHQMVMNWVDWVRAWNEMEWIAELHVVAKATAIKNHIVSIPVICIHLRGDHYSLSLIQTIRSCFSMCPGLFAFVNSHQSIQLFGKILNCLHFFFLSLQMWFNIQIFRATVGYFNVTARCADIIFRLSTSRVDVHFVFAFTINGTLLYMQRRWCTNSSLGSMSRLHREVCHRSIVFIHEMSRRRCRQKSRLYRYIYIYANEIYHNVFVS